MIVVADHAQRQETGLLPFYLFQGIIVTELAECRQLHLLAVVAQLGDRRFNRQTVGVPARDVRHLVAGHVMRAHDDIL